ncbi:MAG: radical SAM protein [Eubacteriaceae bacterium]|nr:radical SAM protein [Eubacteriaceae bacterium]
MKILEKVQSICPVCAKPLPAQYIEENGEVFITKTCQEHGSWKVPVADRVEDYLKWTGRHVVNIPPPVVLTEGADASGENGSECPLHCGPCQNHMQTTCCVLIDVTQRCNQHCPYCFAQAGEGDSGEPSLEEMSRKYDRLLELGEKEYPYNIQLSGGEPTVRDDLPEIVAMAVDKGFNYIQLNTNGKRIAEEDGYAKKLKDAGVSVAFMQFDGLTDDVYMTLRNEPLLATKKKAVENCRKAGLPVTLVPTVVRGVNLDQIGDMISYLLDNVDVVKGIHFQPVSYFGRYPESKNRVTMFDVLHAIEEQADGFKYEDFCPITTGHTLCCFYSTFLKEGDKVTCQVSEETKSSGVSCCDCCGEQDPIDIIKKDRDYVLNKWDLPEQDEDEEESCCCCEPAADEIMDMDRFLQYYKTNTFTLTGMAFMDESNLDAERLKRCRVVQLTDDDRLIPFCAYNGLWRGEK